MFNDIILEHFRNPRNAGELADANTQVEVSNPVCGDILRLSAVVEGGRIVEVRFKAQGCVAVIAASSVLTEMLAGESLEHARALTALSISDFLGGFPPASFHAAQLCADGIVALLRKAAAV